ncbi:MAG: hypothetical protein E7361_02965 [Clostridiales bacterium]|nr:hypothetical protein [Clostridiales bacterium]
MRKLIVLSVLLFIVFSTMYSDNLIDRLNIGYSYCGKEVYCTYYDTAGIPCGDYYITKDNKYRQISFGESITIDGFDIEQFLLSNSAKVIALDYVEDISIYLVYSANLNRYKILNGEKYNLQIACKEDFAKIGYPAIFDSF